MKQKLLIVTFYFPPYNTIASKRWAEMIPELKEKFDVFVFTNDSGGDLALPLPKENIERCDFLKNREFENTKADRSIAYLIFTVLTLGMRSFDLTWFSWFFNNKKKFKTYCDKVAPDIVITTVGPFSTALFGYILKKEKNNVLWGIDFRDSISVFNENKKGYIKRKIDLFIDKFIVTKADFSMTVSDTLAEILSSFYEKKVSVIYNGFVGDKIVEKVKKTTSNKLKLYYAGSLYPHREEAFFLFLDTVKDKKNIEVTIRLVGLEKWIFKYKKYLKNQNIKNVKILKPAVSEIIFNEEQEADVLLIFEDLSKNNIVNRGNLTGKLFEYLKYNSAILAVCSRYSDINKILTRTERGVVVGSSNEIDYFLDNIDKYPLVKFDKIKMYSRKKQAKNVIEEIEKCIC